MTKSKKGSGERSLAKRFKLNALSYGYAQIVTLAVQLLLVPFFLRFWGTEHYADWLVLTGIPTMLTLLDLGVAQTIASKAATQASAGERNEARVSLQTALAFTICLCVLIVFLACTLGILINWSILLGLKTINSDDASLVMLFMSLYLCAGLMGGSLDAWFRTIDRTPAGAFLLANRRVLDILVSVLVLTSGGNQVNLAASLFVAQVIGVVLMFAIAIHWSPWRIFGLTDASWLVFKTNLRPAIAYMGFPVAQIVTLQGGLQLLNQVASPSVVVAFTLGRTLMRFVMQAGVVANNALKPELSRLAGQGKTGEAKRFSEKTSLLIFGGCSLMYIALVIVGPSVIEWWGQGNVLSTRSDLALIGIHALVNVFWFIPAAMLIAVNKHLRVSFAYGFASVASLGLWAIFHAWIPPILGVSILLLVPEAVAVFFTLRNISKL